MKHAKNAWIALPGGYTVIQTSLKFAMAKALLETKGT